MSVLFSAQASDKQAAAARDAALKREFDQLFASEVGAEEEQAEAAPASAPEKKAKTTATAAGDGKSQQLVEQEKKKKQKQKPKYGNMVHVPLDAAARDEARGLVVVDNSDSDSDEDPRLLMMSSDSDNESSDDDDDDDDVPVEKTPKVAARIAACDANAPLMLRVVTLIASYYRSNCFDKYPIQTLDLEDIMVRVHTMEGTDATGVLYMRDGMVISGSIAHMLGAGVVKPPKVKSYADANHDDWQVIFDKLKRK